jgi:RES domain-containing protein
VAFTFEVDGALVHRLHTSRLPRYWRTSRGFTATQALGDAWLASASALALAVPSAIVPEELDFLLNPAHEAFGALKPGPSTPFVLDARLTR